MTRPYRVTPYGGRANTYRRRTDAIYQAQRLAAAGVGPVKVEKHGAAGTLVLRLIDAGHGPDIVTTHVGDTAWAR